MTAPGGVQAVSVTAATCSVLIRVADRWLPTASMRNVQHAAVRSELGAWSLHSGRPECRGSAFQSPGLPGERGPGAYFPRADHASGPRGYRERIPAVAGILGRSGTSDRERGRYMTPGFSSYRAIPRQLP